MLSPGAQQHGAEDGPEAGCRELQVVAVQGLGPVNDGAQTARAFSTRNSNRDGLAPCMYPNYLVNLGTA